MRTTRGPYRNQHRARRTIFHDRGTTLRLLELVDPFDHKKDAKCDNNEVHRDRNEIAVSENRSQFLGVGQRQTSRNLVRQRNVEVAKVQCFRRLARSAASASLRRPR